MTPIRTVLLTLVVALPVAVVVTLIATYFLQDQEDVGLRIRRDCISLTDTVLATGDPASPPDPLSELAQRGITMPESPPQTPCYSAFFKHLRYLPTRAEMEGWQQECQDEDREYRESDTYKKATADYDAKMKELRQSGVYALALRDAFNKKRDEMIGKCILHKAREKGFQR